MKGREAIVGRRSLYGRVACIIHFSSRALDSWRHTISGLSQKGQSQITGKRIQIGMRIGAIGAAAPLALDDFTTLLTPIFGRIDLRVIRSFLAGFLGPTPFLLATHTTPMVQRVSSQPQIISRAPS